MLDDEVTPACGDNVVAGPSQLPSVATASSAPPATVPSSLPDIQRMINQALENALRAQDQYTSCSEESEEDDSGTAEVSVADAGDTRTLDDESPLLGEPISPALAQTVEVRVKQLMLVENITAKKTKYPTIPSNLASALVPTRISTELYTGLPLYANTNDKR